MRIHRGEEVMSLKANTEPNHKPRRLLIPFNQSFFQVSEMKSITWKPWESKKGRPSLIMIFWKKLVNGFLTLATPGVRKMIFNALSLY